MCKFTNINFILLFYLITINKKYSNTFIKKNPKQFFRYPDRKRWI